MSDNKMNLPPFTLKQKKWLKEKFPDLRFTTVDALLSREGGTSEDGTSSNCCCFCCPGYNVAYSYIYNYSNKIIATRLSGSVRTIGEGYDPYRGRIYYYEQDYHDRVDINATYYPLIFVSPYHLSLNMQYKYPDLSPVFPFDPSEYFIFRWVFYLYSRYERHYPLVDTVILDSDEPEHYDAGLNDYLSYSSYPPPKISNYDYPSSIYLASARHLIDPSVDRAYLFSFLSVFRSLAEPIYDAVYSLLRDELNLPGVNR